jgi:4-amino-4-deoxy-L-arabinose transferase-like glycosyltransferase
MLFVVAFAIGLALVGFGFRSQGWVDHRPDPYGFSQLGRNLAEGHGFDGAGVVLRRRAPLYPLLIGAVYAAFGEHPWIVQILQCAAFAGTCVLALCIGRRLFGERTGWIAGWMCALHPGLLRYVADFHLESIFAFLVTWVVHASVAFRERPDPRRGALLGLALGLGSLTKAVILPYAAVFAVLLILESRKRNPHGLSIPWRGLATMAGVLAMVVLPWTIRNFVATGGNLVPITTGFNDAMLRGFVFSKAEYATLSRPPYTDAENESNRWFRHEFQRRGLVWERDDIETERVLGEVVAETLHRDPWALPRKFFVGIATFWYQMTSRANSVVLGVPAILGWGFALVGVARARREGRMTWPVLAPCATLNLELAALLALGRYSVPVLPALMVAAAFGVDTLIRLRTRATPPSG